MKKMARDLTGSTRREAIVKWVMANPKEFTTTEAHDHLPEIPIGTIGSVLALMQHARLVEFVGTKNHRRMYRVVDGATKLAPGRIVTRLRKAHVAPRNHRQRRLPRQPIANVNIAEMVSAWRVKAMAWDKLVAELKLTESDTTEYMKGGR